MPTPALAPPKPIAADTQVTVTDDERPVWSGRFHDFFVDNSGAINLSDWKTLLRDGVLIVGGGAARLLRVEIGS